MQGLRLPLWIGTITVAWCLLANPVCAEPRRLSDGGDAKPRPLPARSQPASTPSTTPSRLPAQTSVWGSLIGLAVVVGGLLFASRWIRVHGPPGLRGLPNEAVEPLGQRVLSRGVAVHLVRCGSRMLVLGVGPDGIRTLSEITDPVEVDLLAGACRRRDEAVPGPSFAQMFSREAATTRPAEVRPRRSASYPEAVDA